jgi:hypothetical protein
MMKKYECIGMGVKAMVGLVQMLHRLDMACRLMCTSVMAPHTISTLCYVSVVWYRLHLETLALIVGLGLSATQLKVS